jgi:hypothetical protein
VRTDLSVNEVLDLANQFRGFDTDSSFYTAVYPVTSEYIDEIWWDISLDEEWETMKARVEQGLPPVAEDVIDPTTGTILATAGGAGRGSVSDDEAGSHSGLIMVRNGSDHDGAAAKAAKALEKMGFTTDVDNADNTDYERTLVVYNSSGQAAEARQIADALGGGQLFLNDGTYALEGDFLVVIGADWKE